MIESVGATQGALRYLRMGTWLFVAVLILELKLEIRLSKSLGVKWSVEGVGTESNSSWKAGQFALANCLRGRIGN